MLPSVKLTDFNTSNSYAFISSALVWYCVNTCYYCALGFQT